MLVALGHLIQPVFRFVTEGICNRLMRNVMRARKSFCLLDFIQFD